MAIATVPTQETVAIAETAKSPMPLRARLVLDGEVHDGTFLFVIGCNTKFAGRDMKLAPRADIGDGKIDVVVLRHASRLQLLRLLRGVFSDSHLSHACGRAQRVNS